MNMTLDEEIKHHEEIVEHYKQIMERYKNCSIEPDIEGYRHYAEYTHQYAEWLKELKRQREAWEMVKAEIEKEHDNIIRDEYSMRQNDYCDGFQFAMKQAFKIIDKHLQEVKTDE